MRYYLANKNREKSGPFTAYQVREKVLKKEFSPEDLGWHDGQDEWSPLSEIPALESILKELKTASPQPTAEAMAESSTGEGTLPATGGPAPPIKCNQVRPVVRFFARTMDIALFTALIALFIDDYSLPARPVTQEEVDTAYDQIWRVAWINAAILFAWNFVEAWLLSAFGTTLGKTLFRVEVRNADGSLLSFRSALLRSFHVWMSGQACGIPVLIDLVKVICFFRLTQQGVTTWDRAQDLMVTHRIIGDRRILAAIGVFLAIAFLLNLAGSA